MFDIWQHAASLFAKKRLEFHLFLSPENKATNTEFEQLQVNTMHYNYATQLCIIPIIFHLLSWYGPLELG
jgi:hypothetical protein